jgi:hypothetical protein
LTEYHLVAAADELGGRGSVLSIAQSHQYRRAVRAAEQLLEISARPFQEQHQPDADAPALPRQRLQSRQANPVGARDHQHVVATIESTATDVM